MDKNLLEQLAAANIHQTYMESKLFTSAASVNQLSARELADLAFVSVLALYVCYYQAETRSQASAYAAKVFDFIQINNDFSTKRILANDLYLAFHGISTKGESMIAGALRPNALASTVWDKAKINVPLLKKMFGDMAQLSLDSRGYIAQVLFRLETDLYVVDSTLRQLRRNAQEWYHLDPGEKVYTIARLKSWLTTHAGNIDLLPIVNKLARSKDID